MNDPTPAPPSSDNRADAEFRWQALFQRSTDALFVLDRQRRLRFVNRAWEALTGLPADEVRMLSCKRQRPSGAGDALKSVLAHALCPPPEVIEGEAGRTRRRLPPGDGRGWRWWDVEFLPLRDGSQLRGVLGRVVPVAEEAPAAATPLPEKLVQLRESVARRYDLALLDSAVPAVRRLADQVRLAASVATPVLLVGEAGTGKEALARTMHYRGAGRQRPLAALDCARLPAAAVAAVLFNEQTATQLGALYLREPACLPRDLQARLCRLIARSKGPRVLAGCRIALPEAVQSGALLDDLHAAFTLVLEVVPLRQRIADLPLVVDRLLSRANESEGPRITGLTPTAWELVRGHGWPGNLRELYDALSAARRQAKGPLLDGNDLPAPLRVRQTIGAIAGAAPERSLPLDALLEQAERRLIELALRRTKGHRGRAAEILGIWRMRLSRRIEALGLGEANDPKQDET